SARSPRRPARPPSPKAYLLVHGTDLPPRHPPPPAVTSNLLPMLPVYSVTDPAGPYPLTLPPLPFREGDYVRLDTQPHNRYIYSMDTRVESGKPLTTQPSLTLAEVLQIYG